MNEHGLVIVQDETGWRLFRKPVRVLEIRDVEAVGAAMIDIARAAEDGLWAAGFIAYEAAPGFDPALRTHPAGDLPLLWFGLYEQPESLSALPAAPSAFSVGTWQPSSSELDYRAALARIKAYIHAGDTYQVNYTIRLNTSFQGDAYALFRALTHAQQAQHCAYVNVGSMSICSASPERFFRLDGDHVTAQPMKGTANRGLWYEDDRRRGEALQASEKNRAENVMIVDMIRNDLGRVSVPGSVRVSSAYDIERYPTVLQMTSTVEARVTAPFVELMAALFPCASITGAPKVRTSEIIHELETGPRGIYTGTVGYLGPGRRASFNVAIRTVLVDHERQMAEYGVGGGIVWDSDGAAEYAECLAKAKILTSRFPNFALLETLLWEPETGYFLLDRHLARLRRSAEYFGFTGVELVSSALRKAAAAFPPRPHRARLTLARSGEPRIESTPLGDTGTDSRFVVQTAQTPIDRQDVFLYHKTTHRAVYEAARATRPDADDVLLFNERGDATEFTIGNIVASLDGHLVTPPVDAGLLPGTFREELLESGVVVEDNIPVKRLSEAEQVWLVNSVRRWLPLDMSQFNRKQLKF